MDVKTLCLGVLTDGDMAGYDIKKYFEHAFAHFFVAGFGSIYPALAELSEQGLVEVTSVEQEKRPDKKVYSITQAGREALCSALVETEPRHKVRSEFLVLMYFAHLLPPRRLAEVLDQRQTEWQQVIGTLEECEAQMENGECEVPPGVKFTIGYGKAVVEAALAYMNEHRGTLLGETESYVAGQEG